MSQFNLCTWARPAACATGSLGQTDTAPNLSILLPTLSVLLAKLLGTCLRNAMIAPSSYFIWFHFSLCSICQSPLAQHLSIACWGCTTLCDFLCSLLYSPHCWRLTVQWNFIRSPWPSCLQSQGKEMHHPASLRDLVYLQLSVLVLNRVWKWQEQIQTLLVRKW